jgi:hypothetical protein
MGENCVPYRRKGLYLALTLPMIALYVAVAAYLWTVGIVFSVLYIALFVLVATAQAYVCVYWQCPYVGKFAPCVGGFCLPSSQIARLYRNVKRSEGTYNFALTLAFVSFVAIILFPVYFLYQLGLLYLLAYLGVVVVYGLCFLLFICPVCGTRHVCPGGQTAVRLRESIDRH